MYNPVVRAAVSISCVLLLPCANSQALAQSFPQSSPQQNSPQLLAASQLDNLVAPIALYPDPLLSQVLAASTYPLEIVEAQQWMQQNGNLQGQSLIEAAKQQNWDPSVQALVAFPEVMALFSRDIRWTTDLGNAFLAQQADVMNAIQRLRFQANNNGRLATTPQQIVSTETQYDQSAIQIQPANPQVIYPPVYDPASVWGPPESGAYPPLSYPRGDYGSGSGSGFGPGIDLLGLFSGLLGSTGWGWALNWFTHSLSLNSLFFNGFGSHNFGGGFNSAGGFNGPVVWAHNPIHRLGVPYSNGFVAARYRGVDSGARFRPAAYTGRSASDRSASDRSSSDGWRRIGGPSLPAYRASVASNTGGFPQGYRNDRGDFRAAPRRTMSSFRSPAPSTRAPAPVARFATQKSYQQFSSRAYSSPQHFSAPRASSSHFSSPHSSAPHFSAPHFSASHGSSHSSGSRHSGGGHSSKSSHKH